MRLKFHTSRPESFAIYRRSRAGGPWEPYQYYSASCQKTYGRPEGQYLRPGQDERVAFCTSEFSDISPLSGGNVAFSTLEGRPSAYNFEESPLLQVSWGRAQGMEGWRDWAAGRTPGPGTTGKSKVAGCRRTYGIPRFSDFTQQKFLSCLSLLWTPDNQLSRRGTTQAGR